MQHADYLDWDESDFAGYGQAPRISRHRLHEWPMFTKEALIEVLDAYPRDELQAFTMGHDPEQPDDWASVDTGNATGEELWQALTHGRVWLNLLWVERFDTRYAELLESMYETLSARIDRLKGYEQPHLTMLMSSPNAQVYYHFDAEDNMLWHVRGEKTMLIYPRSQLEQVDPAIVEDIFSWSRNEDLPYHSSYDALAQRFDMKPGDVASWPHTSPHRIVNSDSLNVSLSTSVITPQTKRRHLTYNANQWLRKSTPLRNLSTRETGAGAAGKRLVYRAAKRLGGVPTPPGIPHIARYRIDPNAERGFMELDEPVRTAFSKA